MEKHSSTQKSEKINGKPSRIGIRFHEEIEKIKDARIKNGKSKDRVSIEKITNLITRHKLWKDISKDIIKIQEKEVEQYGYG